jgi:hypothetical protein
MPVTPDLIRGPDGSTQDGFCVIRYDYGAL